MHSIVIEVINICSKDKEIRRELNNIVVCSDFNMLTEYFSAIINSKKVLIVTDNNVNSLYYDYIEKLFVSSGADISKIIIPEGESNKNLLSINRIYDKCLQHNMDRSSAIIALGGGVIGDIAGFAASTFMRGISFINIPTTLLAQVDSSIGGKTGVNYKKYKNYIGAFFQPSLVYINISILKTLSCRQYLSGIAEVIKYCIISDASLFEYLQENYQNMLSCEKQTLIKIIEHCCRIKIKVVEQDEKDRGIRNILNFGHTIGHALESASDFKLLHGECVALGMIAAAKISLNREMLSNEEYQKIKNLIMLFGLQTKVEFNNKKLMKLIYGDKKSADGNLRFILLNGIGKAAIINNVNTDEILNAIEEIKS